MSKRFTNKMSLILRECHRTGQSEIVQKNPPLANQTKQYMPIEESKRSSRITYRCDVMDYCVKDSHNRIQSEKQRV